jgi:hypothetical protein
MKQRQARPRDVSQRHCSDQLVALRSTERQRLASDHTEAADRDRFRQSQQISAIVFEARVYIEVWGFCLRMNGGETSRSDER